MKLAVEQDLEPADHMCCRAALTRLGIPISGLAILLYLGNPLLRHLRISASDNAYPARISYIQL
jgi:hypothetical protein